MVPDNERRFWLGVCVFVTVSRFVSDGTVFSVEQLTAGLTSAATECWYICTAFAVLVLACLEIEYQLCLRRNKEVQEQLKHRDFHVGIIGSGFGGLIAAIKLKEAGVPFTIFEKSGKVGGTWQYNTYPGCACDVPSHSYSLSFNPNPEWSRKWCEQSETLAYIIRTYEQYDLLPHVRFHTTVTAAHWNDTAHTWTLHTETDNKHGATQVTCNAVIAAVGQLNNPAVPKFRGADQFQGQSFHTAEWPDDYDVSGKNVVCIGCGPSGIQVIPEIAKQAKQVHILQRTPNFFIPKDNYHYNAFVRFCFRYVPLVRLLHRWSSYWQGEVYFRALVSPDGFVGKQVHSDMLKHMKAQVNHNSKLIPHLLPTYNPGCKRVILSSDYLKTLNQPHVKLHCGHMQGFTEHGVVVKPDHSRHEPSAHEDEIKAEYNIEEVDTVVYCTGFKSTDFLDSFQCYGVNQARSLSEEWAGTPKAYKGVCMSGYPNFFMTYGPNTNLGHNSIIFMLECQVNYIVDAMSQMILKGHKKMDVKQDKLREYNSEIQQRLKQTVFTGNCQSWYKTKDGTVVNNWCGHTVEFWFRTRYCDLSAYNTV